MDFTQPIIIITRRAIALTLVSSLEMRLPNNSSICMKYALGSGLPIHLPNELTRGNDKEAAAGKRGVVREARRSAYSRLIVRNPRTDVCIDRAAEGCRSIPPTRSS